MMSFLFIIKNYFDLIHECGFLKKNYRLCKKFKKILMEKNEKYLNYIKNEEESVLEKILNK